MFMAFFPLFIFSISAAIRFLNWSFMIVSIKGHISHKYNPFRILNVCCITSKNIRLIFIVSSFWTSMSYLYQLRDILYCSNNSSFFTILIHGKRISNGSFLDEGHIYFSYATSANQHGYLTCVKYKRPSPYIQQL